MAVTNVNPVAGETLTPDASFSFDIPDGLSSYLVRVTTNGGILEAVYDSATGAGPGYTVEVQDLGATLRLTCKRDAGWSDDPMTVYVTEEATNTSWAYDVFPTAEYPEGMRPYNDSGSGDPVGVVTFEGRSGNVVSASGDYNSDEVTNASTVAGATVSDALEQLDADIAAIPSSPVTSVHGRTGDVVGADGDYTASQVDILTTTPAGPGDVQTLIDQHIGVGIISGGEVTNNGDGTITVSIGTGLLRSSNLDTAPVYSVQWPEADSLALVDNDLNYVYVEYNSGSPQVVTSTTLPTDLNTNLLVAAVHRAGTSLHPTPYRYQQNNLAFQVNRRLYNVDGTTHASGAAISEVGTRNVRVETGDFYLGLNLATYAAHDTSGTDVATYYYRDGLGGWTSVYPVTQVSNTQYDDGSGTLATLSTGRYGVTWVYISPHDQHMYFVYGQGNYTKSQAMDAVAPATLPEQIDNWHGVLCGKIIVLKDSATFLSTESAFEKLFLSGGVDSHGDLTGLGNDDHTQYVHTDGTRQQAALYLAERADHVNTFPAAGLAELWLKDGVTQQLTFTDDNGTDFAIMRNSVGAPSTGDLLYQFGGQGRASSTASLNFSITTGGLVNTYSGAHLALGEQASAPTTAAGRGYLWVKNDTPNRAMFSDDAAADHTLSYLTEVTDGKTARDAVLFTERADHVNAPAASQGELWVRNSILQTPIFTDDLAIDWVIGRASDTAITEGQIPFWSQSSGKYFNGSADFSYDSNTDELRLAGNTAALRLTERASAPTNLAGTSFLYVRNTAPSQLMTVDDTGVEAALVQRPGFRFEYDSTTSGTPASGEVRFNNATQTSATEVYLNYTDKDGVYTGNNLSSLEPGCTVIFTKESDSRQRLIAHIDEVNDHAIGEGPSYITLSPSVYGSSTAWTNMSDGEKLYIDFIAAGSYRRSVGIAEETQLFAETDAYSTGWLWNADIYANPTTPQNALEAGGHEPTWRGSDGTESNLAWHERNLPLSMGATLWHRTSRSINAPAGNTSKTTSDGNLSYIWDDLANRWYHSYFDASLGDYFVTDSPYGYVWAARKLIDSSTTSGDMSWIATNGTICACACDALVYKSTDLTVANLAYTSTVPSATESTMMFYHTGSSLWVHVGYSGTNNYIHTSPDLTTWTQRGVYAIATYGHIVSGDVSRDPYNLTDIPIERIALFSTTYSGMWYSDNATTWSIDTSSQAHGGLQVAHYCPGLWTQDGRGGWMGINSLGDIWYSGSYGAGSWSDSTYNGGSLWKSPEGYQGWCNLTGTASNATVYSVHSIDNLDANVQHYSLVGYLRGGHSMMHDSSSALHRYVLRWGNGVSVYDRFDDAQTIVGRTGPIRK